MKKIFYRNEDGELAASMSNDEFVQAAQAGFGDEGTIEVDDGAKVSRGSDNGAYVQAWVWVGDDVPSDGSKPDPKSIPFTQKQLDRIEKMMGYLPEGDVLENAVIAHQKESPRELKSSLQIKEDQLRAAGGHGVELADEIDALKIALAYHPLKRGEYVIPAAKKVKK